MKNDFINFCMGKKCNECPLEKGKHYGNGNVCEKEYDKLIERIENSYDLKQSLKASKN